MARRAANGIELEVDTFGERSGRPLVLIMGLAQQMIMWDEEFCRALAARGHFVVRFDNRDVGLSTKLDALGVPSPEALFSVFDGAAPVPPPYTLDDMARDVFGLLDALGLESAHVAGLSMGGMIAQTMALQSPERLRSLTSIMSHVGARDLAPPSAEVTARFLEVPPSDRADYLDYSVRLWRAISGPGFPFDEPRVRARAGEAFDRCFHLAGGLRQLAAVLAQPDRRERLRALRLPALVIHGTADPLLPPSAAEQTARALEGSRLLMIEGMGHDLPRGAWPTVIEALTTLTVPKR